VELARKVCADDEPVDQLYATLFEELMGFVTSGDPDRAKQAVQLLFVARYLERIADHATNVAERVIYMVTGEWAAHRRSPGPEIGS
jgi:phosphate transport system protein